MSIKLVDSYKMSGLQKSCFIPVFRGADSLPDFQATKEATKRALHSAKIDNYRLCDDSNGYTLYVAGPNTLAMFLYFFEGDRAEKLNFTVTPDSSEDLEKIVEVLPEFLNSLELRNPIHYTLTDSSLVITFHTRGDYHQAINNISSAFEDKPNKRAKSNTPAPV